MFVSIPLIGAFVAEHHVAMARRLALRWRWWVAGSVHGNVWGRFSVEKNWCRCGLGMIMSKEAAKWEVILMRLSEQVSPAQEYQSQKSVMRSVEVTQENVETDKSWGRCRQRRRNRGELVGCRRE